jgi:hypothetical protein
MSKRIRVFQDEDGKNYAKQMSEEAAKQWLADHPTHTLIR